MMQRESVATSLDKGPYGIHAVRRLESRDAERAGSNPGREATVKIR